MIPLKYEAPDSIRGVVSTLDHKQAMALGGGTTMLDLMKLNVLTPRQLIYVKPLLEDYVRQENDNLMIGAGCTMAKLADSEPVASRMPAIRQSLILAASPQIRNMATIAGNLLQRTRSTYFRHPDMSEAAEGQNFDGASERGADMTYAACLGNDGRLVGTYPGDFAVALVTFDGTIQLTGTNGRREIAARDFYQTPQANQSQYTTQLSEGELITGITIPFDHDSAALIQRSIYLKIRERSSYAFALASVAAGIVLDEHGPVKERTIREAKIGIGGLASIPWHSKAAEKALLGQPASDEIFQSAAEAALADARAPAGAEYKVTLAKRAIVRSLQILRDHGPLNDGQMWAMQHGRA